MTPARALYVGLCALAASCAPSQPAQAPEPTGHCAPLCPRDGQPPSERAVAQVLFRLLGSMEQFRAAGHEPVGVVEDGESATWQALVIEVEPIRDSIVGRLPGCVPQTFTTVIAWRELPAQASAIGFSATTPSLGRTVPMEKPKSSGCWFRRAAAAGGVLVSYVDLLERPAGEYFAESGTVRIDRRPLPIGEPCPESGNWPWKAPGMSCQRLRYTVTVLQGVLRLAPRMPSDSAFPETHAIELSTWNVPGIRLTVDCMDPQASLTWMYCRTF